MHAAFPQQVHGIQDVYEGPAEPIYPPDHDRVARLHVIRKPLHPRPLGRSIAPGRDIGEDIPLLYPGGDESIKLQLRPGPMY